MILLGDSRVLVIIRLSLCRTKCLLGTSIALPKQFVKSFDLIEWKRRLVGLVL